MRFLTIFFLLTLSSFAFAQTKTLTITNIRVHSIGVGGLHTHTKTVQIDEFSTDIYVDDDIIHFKVIPGNADIEYDKNSIVGVITASSDKQRRYGFIMAIIFDITDGKIKIPCRYNLGGKLQFLHKAGNTELFHVDDAQKIATQITLVDPDINTAGITVISPIIVKTEFKSLEVDNSKNATRRQAQQRRER